MADRLLNEAAISLAYELNLQSSLSAYVASPDFDWDVMPDNNARTPPFYAVRFLEGVEPVALMRGSLNTADPQLDFMVSCIGATQVDARKRLGQAKQILLTATGVASGVNFYAEEYPGLPLRDSEATVPSRIGGVLDVDLTLGYEEMTNLDVTQAQNLKYAAHLSVRLSPVIKDVTKDLL